MTLLVDFETKSRADLKAIGGRNYAEHPSTEVLCAVITDSDTGETGVWLPGDPPVVTAEPCAAHNARTFDRHIAARAGWITPEPWIDTAEAARRAGLPGKLDALGTRWFGIPKDKAASTFTIALSKYDDIADAPLPFTPEIKALEKRERAKARAAQLKAWRKRPAAERREAVQRIVVDYCVSDVRIMEHAWPRLEPYLTGGVFGGWERDVLTVDGLINDRGIAFDSQLAMRLLDCDSHNRDIAIHAAAKVCGWTPEHTRDVVNSPKQFAAITGRPDATAETIDTIIAQGGFEVPWIVSLAQARRALATIARGKLEAGIARVSPDGYLRDGMRYYGAHTARWSHSGLQMGNMPRPEKLYQDWGEADILAAIDRVMAGAWIPNGEIMVLLRACLEARAVCDYSSVEARWIAWAAGDTKALDVFRSGRVPYKVAAAMIFGKTYDEIVKGSDEYDIGKKAELACSYGMGPKKFEENYQPSRVGVNAADVVRGWRELHAPIVQHWHELEDAFVAAIKGRATRLWPYDFVPHANGRDVAIFLPSGRPIVYNDVGFSREIGFNGRERMSPYYVGTKGTREHLYGGKIAENVTQAGCRDLLAEALIQAEHDGLAPSLHVHDEIVSPVAGAYDHLHHIMTQCPEWAEGFPVGAAGHEGTRYRK